MDKYIKKEEAIRALLNDAPEQVGYSREDAADCIRYIDAADVAPVWHAYWVPEEHADQVSPTTIHRYTRYYCSECGRRLIGYKNPVDAPYCHCGCKMDLEG